jgi:flagellar biosynthesis/type III secretory pathway chaperone
VKKLIQNLELQKTALNELATLLLQEREAIINNECALLIKLLQQKEDCQAALATLEQNRLLLSGEQTLTQLTATADETAKSLLSSLAEELKNKFRELRSINDTNMLLLKHNLAYFRHLRQTLASGHGIIPYDKNGSLSERPNHLLISKLA